MKGLAAVMLATGASSFSTCVFQTATHVFLHPHQHCFLRSASNENHGSRSSTHLLQTKLQDGSANRIRDVFLLSLDGTLLSNARLKSRIAIQAAFKVWPELISTAQILNMNLNSFDDECWSWLVEKLSALASISQQGNTQDEMLGCDAVFLARVLLEEQLLDGGRSNGRGGQYGGKYHPGWTSDFDSDGSAVGSRPLTVGELYVNWGELREVIEFKYPVIDEKTQRKSDPMPHIRKVLRDVYKDVASAAEAEQTWHPLAYDTLLQNPTSNSSEVRQNAILLLGHEAQLPLALTSFASLGTSFAVNVDLDWESLELESWIQNRSFDKGNASIKVISSSKACDYFTSQINPSILLVVPNAETGETQYDMIKRITLAFDELNKTSGSNDLEVSIVHSSTSVLKRCKLLIDDGLPISHRGAQTCFLLGSDTTKVNLLLPEWADSMHPSDINDSETTPRLNIATEQYFLESITAHIFYA